MSAFLDDLKKIISLDKLIKVIEPYTTYILVIYNI